MNKLLVCAVVALAAVGCKDLTPKQQALVDQVECEVAVLAPHVDAILDARELVLDVYAGKASYTQLGQLLQLSEDVTMALNFELAKCRSPGVPVVMAEDL